MRELVGEIGHLAVIISFVSSLTSSYAFWKSYRSSASEKLAWKSLALTTFWIHACCVGIVIIALFTIIYNHWYEYHYAWSHSSNNLPVAYMISCFWEGQEGSFLLWIFWHVLLGVVLLKTTREEWKPTTMLVFMLVQTFLISMILGVVIPFTQIKIGSSPFVLLKDVIKAPIFQLNPDYKPEDGNGLNPLLQNYWMVIHPPTLFLGFALTLIPFAYCLGALVMGKVQEWITYALPWNIVGTGILGIGIMMGAYWAYETLNFGGYWNWDPVENAVYIPWLISVASIHTMIIYKKNQSALKLSIFLVVATFLLVLYATFLTRSGILGESSVHSFTDLGLSGQLIGYLLFFTGLSSGLIVWRWKLIPGSQKEISAYSREFWIFIGVTTLILTSFQVLVPTSIPVWNQFVKLFGIESRLASPADQVQFYNKFQIWFAIAIALLSGTGQLFFWKKMEPSKLREAIAIPAMLSLLVSAALIVIAKIHNLQHIFLLTSSIYSIIANASILLKLFKSSNFKLAGGSVTHVGIALMLIGILFSAGYSKTISLNNTGFLYNKNFSDEMNREHLLLFRGQPQKMQDYTLIYKGIRMESAEIDSYIDKEDLFPTENPFRFILKKDYPPRKAGDTIQVYHENMYYEIEYKDKQGRTFSLYPRIQFNTKMGGESNLVPSPDIRHFWNKDLYTHVTNIPDPQAETKWSEPETFVLHLGDTFYLNDYVAILESVQRVNQVIGVSLGPEDIAIIANIKVFTKTGEFLLKPYFIIKDKQVGLIPHTVAELGVRILFEKIDPEKNAFTFQVRTTQRDWLILKAVEKPYINLVWIGTFFVSIGLCITAYRRFREIKSFKHDESPIEVY
ncbi:MAG: cytochrome c biogenesis protein CcsA [Cytophagales bacterium]|nr:cytochrome c biogenesis protein CcsA [Cytophagales bacterium]MDW8384230.1 cytochrome c biogenesis protein CcsA [Flammeovirgaceae bacterium]